MKLSPRPVRVAAAVGAIVAAGTTTFLALSVGTASADEPGRCTQNVNVREDPDATSRIVAVCDANTAVKLGEERDGFVRLEELGGWASKDFVKADEQAADAASSDDDSSGSSDAGSSDAGADATSSDDAQAAGHDADGSGGSSPEAGGGSADGEHHAADADGAHEGDGSTGGTQAQPASRPAPRGNRHGLAGLLG